ncbi:hypothetical protein Hypma_014211 [Hypsizygus marmoreus]|uniref:Uncharacterized protein n=1 Tax=Hypsizygus marmoreus TaxID=39966 RepID=A0A369JFG8_HYPMA|nr:hypothetical protein Hypma_014211 [Hypsizygus marmoreus]
MAFSERHHHPASDDGSSMELHHRRGVFLITLIPFSANNALIPTRHTQRCPSHLADPNLVFSASVSVSSRRSLHGEHTVHILPFAGTPPTSSSQATTVNTPFTSSLLQPPRRTHRSHLAVRWNAAYLLQPPR